MKIPMLKLIAEHGDACRRAVQAAKAERSFADPKVVDSVLEVSRMAPLAAHEIVVTVEADGPMEYRHSFR